MQSINDIELTPSPGRKYFNVDRNWDKEIIYFLLVDRFHDGHNRQTIPYQACDYSFERLMSFCGGTIKGIIKNLDYIKELGCTCLWISPVFENNLTSYHGYAIENFLEVDRRFGTKEELIELVALAHQKGLKVILDIVINHTGDNWSYEKGYPSYSGIPYTFGSWRKHNRPVPLELRSPDFYKRMGAIQHWDDYPETREGDIFELKKLNLDETEEGLRVQDIFIKIYSYWIKETDIDGFRLDTVKHLSPKMVARFSSKVRSYAKSLGKESFIVLGEAVGGEKILSRYLKPRKLDQSVYEALDTVLDFPLHFIILDLIKGERSAKELKSWYQKREKKASRWNKNINEYVSFIDNHDQIGQTEKKRVASELERSQLSAVLALLFSLPGVPCLYYGTEQGMKGEGTHDVYLRQPLFDVRTNKDYFDRSNDIYRFIKELSDLRKNIAPLRTGKLFFNNFVVENNADSKDEESAIVFSRIDGDQEIIYMYNASSSEVLTLNVQLSENITRTKEIKTYLLGATGEVNIFIQDNKRCIRVELKPLQFVILD